MLAIKSPPDKDIHDKAIWITSNLVELPIHRLRMYFYHYSQFHNPHIMDVYGKGIKPIKTKWDLLSRAKYIVAIENSIEDHGWTEKLSDAYLSYCLPLYYGPDNIDEYFPSDSYIRIDITKPEQALKIIQDAIANNEWEKRLPAIIEARKRVLNQHSFAPWMTKFLNDTFVAGDYEAVTIKKHLQHKNIFTRVYHKILISLEIIAMYYQINRIQYSVIKSLWMSIKDFAKYTINYLKNRVSKQ